MGNVEVVVDRYRVDGTRLLLAEALVGDETGSIYLRIQENNIELLRSASQANGALEFIYSIERFRDIEYLFKRLVKNCSIFLRRRCIEKCIT